MCVCVCCVASDVGSEEKKGEWREMAKKELDDWCKHRDEQLEKTKSSNRCGAHSTVTSSSS